MIYDFFRQQFMTALTVNSLCLPHWRTAGGSKSTLVRAGALPPAQIAKIDRKCRLVARIDFRHMADLIGHMAASAYSSLPFHNHLRLAEIVQAGLPTATFNDIAKKLGIKSLELAAIVQIAPRTFLRRTGSSARLKPDESERALRVGRLLKIAEDVFEDSEAASRWFQRPLKVLGGRTPLSLCATEPGARAVEQALGRIEHGVIS